MIQTAYEALVLDIDGTLATDEGEIRPRNRAALRAARAAGVRVMLATGRSEGSTVPLLADLGLDTPAILYNGAGVFCPVRGRLIEERLLGERTVRKTLAFAGARGILPVVMRYGAKFAPPPRDAAETDALRLLTDLCLVADGRLPIENLLRISLFSGRHASLEALAADLQRAVDLPAYVTHFPLAMLPGHRASPLFVADVQPPCRGKAEALRVLEERYGIPAARVVAVGDAQNDLPLLEEAGLGVAMANAVPEARAAADRVIGSNNSDAIAELVEELFGVT
ncbi:MAG: HAD-IIB family hydrolase [Planctomycetota bacterium]